MFENFVSNEILTVNSIFMIWLNHCNIEVSFVSVSKWYQNETSTAIMMQNREILATVHCVLWVNVMLFLFCKPIFKSLQPFIIFLFILRCLGNTHTPRFFFAAMQYLQLTCKYIISLFFATSQINIFWKIKEAWKFFRDADLCTNVSTLQR